MYMYYIVPALSYMYMYMYMYYIVPALSYMYMYMYMYIECTIYVLHFNVHNTCMYICTCTVPLRGNLTITRVR